MQPSPEQVAEDWASQFQTQSAASKEPTQEEIAAAFGENGEGAVGDWGDLENLSSEDWNGTAFEPVGGSLMTEPPAGSTAGYTFESGESWPVPFISPGGKVVFIFICCCQL